MNQKMKMPCHHYGPWKHFMTDEYDMRWKHLMQNCQNAHRFLHFGHFQKKVRHLMKARKHVELIYTGDAHAHTCQQMTEWWWDSTPEGKQWAVLRNGWDGGSEGRGANLQVRQAGWPLLGAAARVCAYTRRHVAVKWICIPRFCDIVTWRHLPGSTEEFI